MRGAAVLQAQVHAGQIAASSVAQLTAVLESMPRDHDSVAAWMGRLVTTPRGLPEACPVDTPYTVEEFQRQVQVRCSLGLSLNARRILPPRSWRFPTCEPSVCSEFRMARTRCLPHSAIDAGISFSTGSPM